MIKRVPDKPIKLVPRALRSRGTSINYTVSLERSAREQVLFISVWESNVPSLIPPSPTPSHTHCSSILNQIHQISLRSDPAADCTSSFLTSVSRLRFRRQNRDNSFPGTLYHAARDDLNKCRIREGKSCISKRRGNERNAQNRSHKPAGLVGEEWKTQEKCVAKQSH